MAVKGGGAIDLEEGVDGRGGAIGRVCVWGGGRAIDLEEGVELLEVAFLAQEWARGATDNKDPLHLFEEFGLSKAPQNKPRGKKHSQKTKFS